MNRPHVETSIIALSKFLGIAHFSAMKQKQWTNPQLDPRMSRLGRRDIIIFNIFLILNLSYNIFTTCTVQILVAVFGDRIAAPISIFK